MEALEALRGENWQRQLCSSLPCPLPARQGMKGTGRWTIQEAAERSTAAPTMAAALDARYLSARKDERVEASGILGGPSSIPKVPKEQLVEDLKAALYCSKICSYAQVRAAVQG